MKFPFLKFPSFPQRLETLENDYIEHLFHAELTQISALHRVAEIRAKLAFIRNARVSPEYNLGDSGRDADSSSSNNPEYPPLPPVGSVHSLRPVSGADRYNQQSTAYPA